MPRARGNGGWGNVWCNGGDGVGAKHSRSRYHRDVRQLRDFDRLHTLILDNNRLTSHVKFPKLPQLRTLWVNKNNISNLSIFVDHLVAATPNLRYLSMLGNDACPNYFNGGTLKQYQDYRHVLRAVALPRVCS